MDGTAPDTALLRDPATAASLGFGFHASVTLRTQDGHAIGTLCVLDVVPRDVKPEHVTSLDDLASVVLRYLESSRRRRRSLVTSTLDQNA